MRRLILKALIGFSLALAACWYAGNSAEAGNHFLGESPTFITRNGSPRLLQLAQAGSSQINPNVPIQGGPLTSAPLRSNFAAAQSDVNNIYSILTGTATGQMLQSVNNGTPIFSTAVWPSTTTLNQMLYSSANNVVVGLPTVNNAILVTNSSGQPSFSSAIPASVIPFPTVSTLGGVLSSTCGANTWVNQLNTSGVFVCTQPGFSNLSGNVTLAQFPSIGANTVIANFTASSGTPTGFTIGSCSGTFNALNYTSGTGIGCNTSLVALNVAQNWTAVQTFNNNDIALKGSSTGTTAFTSANASGSNFTLTFPAATDTVDLLGTPQTFTAIKTFTNSDFALLGSSTGFTTFTSANTSGSNFTLTFPAATDTVAVLGTADQVQAGGARLTPFSIGTVSSGTSTIDCGKNPVQFLLNGGAFTLAAPANDGACLIQAVQGPSAGAITLSGFSTSPSGTGDTVATANTTSATVTISNASPAVITWTQTFVAGQVVYFTTTGALPTGLTASTLYYVISTGLSGTAFEVSATPGGSAINTSSAGSGTQTGHEPAIFTANIFRVDGLSTILWKQQQ